MKGVFKKLLGIILITGLLFSLSACSSSSSSSEDILTDTSQLMSAINRVEKFTPGGMNFTKEQAEQILDIISPVVNGAIYTSDLAENIYDQMNKVLTKEQKALIDETTATLGTPMEGAVPGSGAGQGGGMGMGGGGYSGTGTPPTGTAIGDAGTNVFFRIDQIITDNYLSQ